MESFLVALAMAILKYYAPKGVESVLKWWHEQELLKANEKGALKRDTIINDPNASLEDKLRANDEFGA